MAHVTVAPVKMRDMPAQSFNEIPGGEVIGTYRTHEQAQEAVKFLAGKEFDVKALTILGTDLRIVERVLGLTSWAQAAIRGAVTGLWLGLLLALVLSFTGGNDNLTSSVLLPGAVIGIGVGILWGLLTHALRRRSGSVTSQPQVVAKQYDVLCSPGAANEARNLLAKR